ncbi:MAG: hypothetical protein CMF31_07455 [Kordiimonas sp.]|nr:hypothetical protein [Kordiimonas sp.]|tara:strand:+ start:993 stop:1958 length:966 start_codon:yes stop_codon:yes gene_type:complete
MPLDRTGHYDTPDILSLQRDLDWIQQSPFLYQSATVNPAPATRLSRLGAVCANNPAPLQNLLSDALKRPRLGYYYEQLLGFLLTSAPEIDSVLQNIPVQGEARTLGEFDILLRSATSLQCQHWEVAIKYYLGIPPCDHEYHWVGPGLRDRLDIKLDRLRHHQMRLAQTEEGKRVLIDCGFWPISSAVLVKGYLFHPLPQWYDNKTITAGTINPAHLKGWWATITQWQDHFLHSTSAQDGIRWVVLHKPCWLAPAHQSEAYCLSAERLYKEIAAAAEKQPVMVAALQPAKNAHMTEIHRGFIVPDLWPTQAKQIANPAPLNA